jgi:hypothetical protein
VDTTGLIDSIDPILSRSRISEMRTALLVLAFWLTVTSLAAAAAADHGHLEGTVQAEWLNNALATFVGQ